jgi:phage tail sheath gpL-like
LVTDDDNVEHLETIAEFMGNGEQGRGALHIGSNRSTYSDFITWSAARERWDFSSIFLLSTMGWRTPPHHVAAIVAGLVSAEINPSVPFLNVRLPEIEVSESFTRPVTYDATVENVLRHGGSILDIDGDTGDVKLVALISTKTKLTSGPATDVWESVHVFFVQKFVRRAILSRLTTVYSTPASKKMVPGREEDVRGNVYQVLNEYASDPYYYLSAAALEENKSGIVVRRDPNNSKRIQIGVPAPIIQEHRGTDVELFVIRP